MADTKQKESSSQEKKQTAGFNCSCMDFEAMSEMMKNFCKSDTDSFNCKTMMQQMCCSAPEAGKK